MVKAQSVGATAEGMEAGDGVLGVVGVDVEQAAPRTHGHVRVVAQGADRGAELGGHVGIRRGVWADGEAGVMPPGPSAADSP